jgi:FkbM family methyltransferase
MPSLIRKSLNNALHKFGYELTKIHNDSFGIRWLNDVKRLSDSYGKKINVAFDVGANIGVTTKEMLQYFDSSKVYAFECHPNTFNKLTKNLAGTSAYPFEIALSNTSGSDTFYDYGDEGYINSLTPNAPYAVRFKKKAAELNVIKTTIDEFCFKNSISKIDLLKIDTEGHDINVLRGGQKMLSSNSVAFVYFEFNDFYQDINTDGGSLNEITQYLSGFGFKFVATYTDYIVTEEKMFVVANALLFNPNA